jgi:hypothetical protein
LILVAQKSSFLRTLLSSIKRSNRTKVSTRILNILTNVFQSDEIPSTTLPRSESRSLFLKLVRTCQVVAIEAQDFTSQRCSLRGICDISRRPCPRGACSPVFKNKPDTRRHSHWPPVFSHACRMSISGTAISSMIIMTVIHVIKQYPGY